MQGIKSAKLAISNLAPNTFISKFLNVSLVNFFKNVSHFLPNPGFRSIQVKKSAFSFSKDTLAFSFLFPSVLLSCWHHSKAKFRMYFPLQSFCIFEWCVTRITLCPPTADLDKYSPVRTLMSLYSAR